MSINFIQKIIMIQIVLALSPLIRLILHACTRDSRLMRIFIPFRSNQYFRMTIIRILNNFTSNRRPRKRISLPLIFPKIILNTRRTIPQSHRFRLRSKHLFLFVLLKLILILISLMIAQRIFFNRILQYNNIIRFISILFGI